MAQRLLLGAAVTVAWMGLALLTMSPNTAHAASGTTLRFDVAIDARTWRMPPRHVQPGLGGHRGR